MYSIKNFSPFFFFLIGSCKNSWVNYYRQLFVFHSPGIEAEEVNGWCSSLLFIADVTNDRTLAVLKQGKLIILQFWRQKSKISFMG